jgi:hypothetical protein
VLLILLFLFEHKIQSFTNCKGDVRITCAIAVNLCCACAVGCSLTRFMNWYEIRKRKADLKFIQDHSPTGSLESIKAWNICSDYKTSRLINGPISCLWVLNNCFKEVWLLLSWTRNFPRLFVTRKFITLSTESAATFCLEPDISNPDCTDCFLKCHLMIHCCPHFPSGQNFSLGLLNVFLISPVRPTWSAFRSLLALITIIIFEEKYNYEASRTIVIFS